MSADLPDATLWWPYFAAICEAEFSFEDLRARPALWTIWLVSRIDGEVRNGGWGQLFFNLRDADITDAEYIAALEAVGADDAAALCRSMLAALDGKPGQRAAFVAGDFWDMPRGLQRTFTRASMRFYGLDPTTRVRLDEWIRDNADDPDIRDFAAKIEPYDAFNGRTPLHVAVDDGNRARVQRLLAAGVDPNAGDDDGDTPLILAVKAGESASRLGIVDDLLAAGADPDAAGDDGRRPLLMAAGSKVFTAVLLAGGADPTLGDADGDTPLHDAADTRVAGLLLKAGAPVNARNAMGQTPLMRAALRCSLGNGRQVELKVVDRLLKVGAEPAVDGLGRDAYWYACESYGAMKRLEAAGFPAVAEPDADGRHGYTALHRAAGLGDNDGIRLLIERGMDPNVRLRVPLAHPPVPAGATPLDVAKIAGGRGTARVLANRGGKTAAGLDAV